jgi:BON domain-containing protein
MERQRHKRIVVETSSGRRQRGSGRHAAPRPRESMVAVTVIAAATLATFLALFVTSRPYDPMDSTMAPQQVVPQGPATPSPSPKASPTTTPAVQGPSSGQVSESAGETKVAPVDDATIQAEIEKTIARDSTLATLDLNTIVEGGRVTLAGSVRSTDLKQRVERAVRSVRGVISVDNQLVITAATP